MRFRELLEYKRDITATNYSDKLLSRAMDDDTFIRHLQTKVSTPMDDNFKEVKGWLDNWANENQDKIADMILSAMENADPSPNKQYVQWIVLRYLDKSIKRFEDILSTISTLLVKYHQLKIHRTLPSELSDIGKVKSGQDITDMWRAVDVAHNELYQKLQKAKKENLPRGNAKDVFNNKEMRVVVPQDQNAACYYGQGTAWCTASVTSRNYFDHYNADGPLYIIIPKQPTHEGEKYQLHFESGQYMDETDSQVNLVTLFNERFTDKSTFEFFNRVTNIGSLLVFVNNNVFEDIVSAIKEQVQDYVYDEVTEWQIDDPYYYDWLKENGYVDEDGDVKDDAPDYLEYNDDARMFVRDILDDVDISKEDVMAWDEDWDDDESYSVKELPYVVASILRDKEERGHGARGHIADQIERNLALEVTQEKGSTMPSAWTLYHEYQQVRNGKSKWKKDKVAEKKYAV